MVQAAAVAHPQWCPVGAARRSIWSTGGWRGGRARLGSGRCDVMRLYACRMFSCRRLCSWEDGRASAVAGASLDEKEMRDEDSSDGLLIAAGNPTLTTCHVVWNVQRQRGVQHKQTWLQAACGAGRSLADRCGRSTKAMLPDRCRGKADGVWTRRHRTTAGTAKHAGCGPDDARRIASSMRCRTHRVRRTTAPAQSSAAAGGGGGGD